LIKFGTTKYLVYICRRNDKPKHYEGEKEATNQGRDTGDEHPVEFARTAGVYSGHH
jgi:hypothetical protein